MQRPLTLLALVALSFTGLAALRTTQQRRRLAAKVKPEVLQTWEGEGGGLPNGGPGQTVSPTAPAGDAAVYSDAAERESSA
jgi:hypothetical protein